MATTTKRLLAAGEGKKIWMIALVCFAVAHSRRSTARKRWLKGEVEDEKTRWVDHPIVPYLLENTYIIGAALLFRDFVVVDPNRRVITFLTLLLRSMFSVNLGLLFQRTCAQLVYKHVPYFSTTKPSSDIRVIFSDYMRCNFVVDIFNSGLMLMLIGNSKSVAERAIVKEKQFYVFPYLGKLLLGRIIVDIAFYVVHRWLHTDWAYKNIHARHHEHTAPRLQTNFHFEALDLFLEASAPLILSSIIANALGIRTSPFEEDLMFQTLFLYEAGSHTGKELPVVTWFPPLSPIVDYFTGCDQRLIEYHTRHHQLFNCNYSISPWPDKLMGSYKMEYKVPAEQERAATTAAPS